MSETEEVRDAVGDALADVLGRRGYMVTRWVVGAEVISEDGERYVWGLAPHDQKAWDSLGIIRYLDHVEAAGLVRDGGEVE